MDNRHRRRRHRIDADLVRLRSRPPSPPRSAGAVRLDGVVLLRGRMSTATGGDPRRDHGLLPHRAVANSSIGGPPGAQPARLRRSDRRRHPHHFVADGAAHQDAARPRSPRENLPVRHVRCGGGDNHRRPVRVVVAGCPRRDGPHRRNLYRAGRPGGLRCPRTAARLPRVHHGGRYLLDAGVARLAGMEVSLQRHQAAR